MSKLPAFILRAPGENFRKGAFHKAATARLAQRRVLAEAVARANASVKGENPESIPQQQRPHLHSQSSSATWVIDNPRGIFLEFRVADEGSPANRDTFEINIQHAGALQGEQAQRKAYIEHQAHIENMVAYLQLKEGMHLEWVSGNAPLAGMEAVEDVEGEWVDVYI